MEKSTNAGLAVGNTLGRDALRGNLRGASGAPARPLSTGESCTGAPWTALYQTSSRRGRGSQRPRPGRASTAIPTPRRDPLNLKRCLWCPAGEDTAQLRPRNCPPLLRAWLSFQCRGASLVEAVLCPQLSPRRTLQGNGRAVRGRETAQRQGEALRHTISALFGVRASTKLLVHVTISVAVG